MGMTYLQFKTVVRFALAALIDLKSQPDGAQKAAKLDKIIENLQKALED